MIFIDTPGIHKPKNKLGEFMVNSASSTFSEVDVIVMVCDATDKSFSRIDENIIESLKASSNKPVILVADTFNRVVFMSQGYSIGLGEQLVKVINQLSQK
jgi:GTP-binding protein Era